MEQDIIQRIKNTVNEMNDVPYKNPPVRLESLTRKILLLLNDLENATSDKTLKADCNLARSKLSHTLLKEVKWADNAYLKTLKKHATNIRTPEYHIKLHDAIRLIQMDLIDILHDSADEE